MHRYRLGIIGNCSYMAYIDDQAAVRWLCMPRFDSSFLFGSLLDEQKGGHFYIRPLGQFKTRQYYLTNTNILCTEFEHEEGSFRVTDFAPRFYQYDRYFRPLMLVRKLEPLRGQGRIQVRCLPVGDYGRIRPEVVLGSNHIRYLNLGGHVRVTTDIPLNYVVDGKPFVLNGVRYLVLTYGPPLEAPLAATAEDFLDKTRRYWQQWVKTISVAPIFQEEAIRSALALKLHQFEDTGAIIAAGTTSLPECPGSGRTWDYRYCWLRDTYYILTAFNNVGHFEELERYFQFVQNLLAGDEPEIRPVYTVTGDPVLEEWTLPLDGYMGNRPVRIGNAATSQRQFDVYGQVLISLLPLYVDKRLCDYDMRSIAGMVNKMLDRIELHMDEPDSGIWEFRSTHQRHCYMYLFHWVGAMAAQKLGQLLGDTDMTQRAAYLAQQSAARIEGCYDHDRRVYTQAIGSDQLDASTLQLISLNYLECGSEKARLHLEGLERQLKANDGLFFRYVHEDDFGKPKAGFLPASFWHAEALACVGRLDEAMDVVAQLLSYANHLGLFSEVVMPDGSQWGNFPQAYSHVGLLNAVYRIARRIDRPIFL
ncbi:MAG: glycoside hydrolase family 15 protein [Sedimentisphaerales bacterium]|nr:glycoside hydrolase family 15 protein [Sedimentisphaerales bacterium]